MHVAWFQGRYLQQSGQPDWLAVLWGLVSALMYSVAVQLAE